MEGLKRFAHTERPEKRQGKRKLFFSVLLITPLFSSCAPTQASQALPPKSTITQTYKEPAQQKDCKPDLRGWLGPGETVIESICRTKYDFVLTNAALYTVRKHGKVVHGKITFTSSCSIRDLRETLSKGCVDWTASEETAFILTRDGLLTLVPVGLRGDKLPGYRVLFFSVENAKITFHAGKLFIAGEEQLMVLTFSDPEKVKSRVYSFILETKDRDFFVSEGKLFFGNQEEKFEIRVTGEEVELY